VALAVRLTDAYASISILANAESEPGGTQCYASKGAVAPASPFRVGASAS
jgi:hypothetical protein